MTNTPNEMPDNVTDRPLVTFALLAYNQEEFIREAVEGAFAQTYEPLEIILSDDCSSDRTYEIMQEMADSYQGPHRVLVRQTGKNLRPYSHVLDLIKTSKGELVVLAAGDDISMPERVAVLCRAWQSSGAWAFHSLYDLIDERSEFIARSQRSMSLVAENCELRSYFYAEDGPIDVVHGATSAYDRRLLLLAPGDAGGLLSEDAVFTILLNLAGKDAKFVDLPLVSYRQHAGAISNTSRIHLNNSVDDSRSLLEKEQRYSKNIVDRAKLALHSENMPGLKARRLNKAALWEDILLHGAKCNWSNLSFANRFHALAVAFRKRRIGFLLPSILGKRLGPRYLSLRLRSKDLDELKSFMHRYLNIKNYADYARRRSFWLFKRVLLLGSNVHIAINADISPLCSIVPGKGSIRIGAYSVIQRGAVLRNYGSKIEIGRHSTIGHNCVLYSGADLIVGEGVRIGPLTAIIAGNHRFEDREIPIYLQGMKNRGVKIDDDVWIGAGAKILAGVSIGHGAVVAAGAVVTRSVREWEIVAGVPARVIGVRGNK